MVLSLSEFLETCQKRLTSIGSSLYPLNAMNADIDSIISAIGLSYLYYTDDWKGNYIPVISCLPEYYKLKPELHAILDHCKLSGFTPVFIDEVPWGELYRKSISRNIFIYIDEIESLNIYMINHNSPMPALKNLNSSVVCIIDRHRDQHNFLHLQGEYRKILFNYEEGKAAVGSCSTLVTEFIYKQKPSILKPPFSTLMLGGILLETQNLKSNEVTELDKNMVKVLIECENKLEFNPNNIYKLMVKNRFSENFWGKLTIKEILNYDKEEYLIKDFKYIICGTFYPVHNFIKNNGNVKEIYNLIKSKPTSEFLKMVIIMSVNVKDNSAYREIGLFCIDPTLEDRIIRVLIHPLQLERFSNDVSNVYTQKATNIKRKDLVNAMNKFLLDII